MEQLTRKACQGRVVYLAASISMENLKTKQSNYFKKEWSQQGEYKVYFVILSVSWLIQNKCDLAALEKNLKVTYSGLF